VPAADQRSYWAKRGDVVEGVVEDRRQAVADARVGDQLGIAEQRDRLAEQVDAGERADLTGEQQYGAADPRPVLGAQVLVMLAAVPEAQWARMDAITAAPACSLRGGARSR
jgi:hypothetical protein